MDKLENLIENLNKIDRHNGDFYRGFLPRETRIPVLAKFLASQIRITLINS